MHEQRARQNRHPRIALSDLTDDASSIRRRQIADLRAITGYWSTLSGLLTIFFTLFPIGASLLDPLLPDVSRIAAPVLALTLTILLLVCLYFSSTGLNQRNITTLAQVAFAVAIVFLVVYFMSWINFVVYVDGNWYLTGTALTEEAATAIQRGAIQGDTRSLLDRFGHVSQDRIWVGRKTATSLLTISFAGFTSFAAGSFFLFTLASMRGGTQAESTSEHA